ncbi:Flp family type IVb pilin [Nocardioides coralli]|uniref:Flp family type IVb pilin n=1 Tax=Nocardioides coralli TaxID=2872154 RepID=UPI001CA39400|nr:Flp family type IVb pilin [Nocardioides coralli]QZY28017.1 Flp family type IVb pilin [Nocardioides coralli]
MATRRTTPERGASSVEYALLITGIAVVLVVVIFSMGDVTKNMFGTTCEEIDREAQASASCNG